MTNLILFAHALRVILLGDTTPSPQPETPKQVSEEGNSPDRDLSKQQPREEGGGDGVQEGKDEDPSQSEGVLKVTIPKFSQPWTGSVLSPPNYVRNLPW